MSAQSLAASEPVISDAPSPRHTGYDARTRALIEGPITATLIRLAAPMSFGVLHVAPLLPEFLTQHPDIAVTPGTTSVRYRFIKRI